MFYLLTAIDGHPVPFERNGSRIARGGVLLEPPRPEDQMPDGETPDGYVVLQFFGSLKQPTGTSPWTCWMNAYRWIEPNVIEIRMPARRRSRDPTHLAGRRHGTSLDLQLISAIEPFPAGMTLTFREAPEHPMTLEWMPPTLSHGGPGPKELEDAADRRWRSAWTDPA